MTSLMNCTISSVRYSWRVLVYTEMEIGNVYFERICVSPSPSPVPGSTQTINQQMTVLVYKWRLKNETVEEAKRFLNEIRMVSLRGIDSCCYFFSKQRHASLGWSCVMVESAESSCPQGDRKPVRHWGK